MKKYTNAEVARDTRHRIIRMVHRMQKASGSDIRDTGYIDGNVLVEKIRKMDEREKKAKGGR